MDEEAGPGITGIHHFSVTVRDIETSVAWYQRVFRADRVPMEFPHYEREDTGYGVLLVEPRSGLAIGLHTNTGNTGERFDEARTGLDHVGFNVSSRDELEAWTAWLDGLGVEHSGIRMGDAPFPFATLVFRDPDNIQLELFAVL
jgi:glyoxylase I family protein